MREFAAGSLAGAAAALAVVGVYNTWSGRRDVDRSAEPQPAAPPAAVPGGGKPHEPAARRGDVPEVVAFIGLGEMGFPMAARLTERAQRCICWNRDTRKTADHAKRHGSETAATLHDVSAARIIFLCLPTSDVVQLVVDQLQPALNSSHILVDCTSGSPQQSRAIAAQLARGSGARYLDAPVRCRQTRCARRARRRSHHPHQHHH
jgi:hypothetical protein